MKRSGGDTVAKGTRFEVKVFNYLRKYIDDGHFFAPVGCCRLFRQKRYASRERRADIKFDITIEVTEPNASQYSLLVVVECKDYKNPVPVSDLEVLDSRMRQVSGCNTKGIVVATSALQSAAITFARSNGVAIARWFSAKDIKWELRRTPPAWGFRAFNELSIDAAQHAIASETSPSSMYEVYGLSDRGTNSLAELVIDAIRSHAGMDAPSQLVGTPVDVNPVPYRSQEMIEEEVASVLGELDYRDGRVPLSRILELQRRRTGLDLEIRAPTPEEQRRGTLGCFDLEARRISIITCEPHEVDRQQFTIAHELGHHFLGHGDILARERFDIDDIDESGVGGRISNKGLRRMEIQANMFAGSLLLPKQQFLRDMMGLAVEFNLRDKGHGLIYLDDQRCNIDDHLRITQRLRVKYGVSRSAITHRLKTFGLLTIAPPQPLKDSPWLASFR